MRFWCGAFGLAVQTFVQLRRALAHGEERFSRLQRHSPVSRPGFGLGKCPVSTSSFVMQNPSPIRRRKPSENGYMLISVMILLAIFLIAMAVGVPKVAESIQRDREVETMHRGKQYIRAIQLYFRKFHAYPPNLDALVKTNEIRFLRKKYIDPMTGKDDWKPIMYCQNKTPMAMGFFGQPLGGAGCGALAGIGPAGGPSLGGANGLAGSNNGSGASLMNTGGSTSSAGGGLFSNTSGGVAGAGSGTTGTGTDGSPGAGAVDANGTPINNTGSPLSTGQTFGGGGIVGVEPVSPKQSILIYKKKNHYNEWEFLYSQLMDQQMVGGGNAGTIGQPANGAPGFNQPSPGIGGVSQPGTGINQNGGANQPGNNNGSTPILPPPDPPSTTPQQ
jgi:type II secretory pathway pseudopilin PulG